MLSQLQHNGYMVGRSKGGREDRARRIMNHTVRTYVNSTVTRSRRERAHECTNGEMKALVPSISAPIYDRTRVPKGWISLKAIRKDGVSTDVLFEETKIKSPNYRRCGRL